MKIKTVYFKFLKAFTFFTSLLKSQIHKGIVACGINPVHTHPEQNCQDYHTEKIVFESFKKLFSEAGYKAVLPPKDTDHSSEEPAKNPLLLR